MPAGAISPTQAAAVMRTDPHNLEGEPYAEPQLDAGWPGSLGIGALTAGVLTDDDQLPSEYVLTFFGLESGCDERQYLREHCLSAGLCSSMAMLGQSRCHCCLLAPQWVPRQDRSIQTLQKDLSFALLTCRRQARSALVHARSILVKLF